MLGQWINSRASSLAADHAGPERRMKVLLIGTSLQPRYGGPAVSLSQLALGLSRADVNVGIWAPDGSAIATPFLTHGSALERLSGQLRGVFDRFGVPDVIHDNGLWLSHNHALAKLAAERNI